MMILVADDDPLTQRVWTRMLMRLGHLCVAVAAGEELIHKCAELRPQAVISDVDLEDGDGIHICLALRRNYPTLPIAIMTGSHSNLERARRAGFHCLLLKPFVEEQAEAVLAELSE